MDLIDGIKYLENRLGGRKPDQGKRQPAQKTAHDTAVIESNAATAADCSATEFDTPLGRKLDTTA